MKFSKEQMIQAGKICEALETGKAVYFQNEQNIVAIDYDDDFYYSRPGKTNVYITGEQLMECKISVLSSSAHRKKVMIDKLQEFHKLAQELSDLNSQPINLDLIIEEYGCELTAVTEQLIQDFDRIDAEDF